MVEKISPKVQDDGVRDAEGKPITGGSLFRKYLFNRCQIDFECGGAQRNTPAVTATAKVTENQAIEETAKDGKDGKEENEQSSNEYYVVEQAKRRSLCLIRFMGELFKLGILTERIMHECIKKLLTNVDSPEEEEIKSLCKLLTTVGHILDTEKARKHIDVYLSRMKDLCMGGNVNSRMRFMLQDLIELRERKWVPREAAAKQKAVVIAAVVPVAGQSLTIDDRAIDAPMELFAVMAKGAGLHEDERWCRIITQKSIVFYIDMQRRRVTWIQWVMSSWILSHSVDITSHFTCDRAQAQHLNVQLIHVLELMRSSSEPTYPLSDPSIRARPRIEAASMPIAASLLYS
ncbi:hypothetical protein EVG20_g11224 [Dentipellis fragilis]|uniref:MIF4G domain-containing protein n=1 Tax=Dentipellis fragilis TaxID=205917 RepID=A0A4Y9XLP3_9AGAM|nr:hypothetical protein EVG20_g11224 [Dentipellis fragilis]